MGTREKPNSTFCPFPAGRVLQSDLREAEEAKIP